MFTNLLAAVTTEKVVTIISIIAVASLFVIAIVLCATQKKLGNKNAKAVVYGAIAVAMSFVLSYIAFYKMPYGGSITLASLVPIIIYAYCFGVSRGLIVGLVYGLLQFVQAPYFINFTQFILDYLLAFASIATAGFFKRIKNVKISLPLATTTACVVRLCFHILAGVIFYSAVGSRAPILPSLIGDIDALPAFVYALVYNSLFLIPELIISVVVIVLLTQNKVFVSKVRDMSTIGNAFTFLKKKPLQVDDNGDGVSIGNEEANVSDNESISDTEKSADENIDKTDDIKIK